MNLSPYVSMLMATLMAMLAMAFYTLMERKFLAYWQTRKGPNKVSVAGIPQPLADAIKLFTKERSTPTSANYMLFYLAPLMSMVLTLMLWTIFPHSSPSMFMTFGVLYFLCVSSINVYSTFISGWCANSKYALLGALRSIAQTISYEVSMALILLSDILLIKYMDLHLMNFKQITPTSMLIIIMFFMWFITTLAETNRTPFDLAEGESELVSGFNIEYSGGLFTLIFMAEYMNILFMSLLTTTLFLGSNPMNIILIMKTLMLATMFLWARATLPRMRYDNLMYLTWKSFLPITLTTLMLIIIML